MQEAFRKAAEKNPGSNLNRQVKDASRSLYEERQEQTRRRQRTKEIDALVQIMRSSGSGWWRSVAYRGTKLEKEILDRLRKSWDDRSINRELQSASQTEKESMLMGFAEGAMLDRLPLPSEYRMTMLDVVFEEKNALNYLQGMFGKTTLSPQAHLMAKAFGDMMDYNGKQRSSLIDFMIETPDTREVTIAQSITRISAWISSHPIQ